MGFIKMSGLKLYNFVKTLVAITKAKNIEGLM
jgi:hypothetical protein